MPTIKMKQSVEEMFATSSMSIHYRKVKIALYSIDVVVGVLLAITLAFYYGIQVKPLFVPLDMMIFTAAIIEFVVFTESVIFKLLELRTSELASAKLMILRRLNNRALIALLISLMLVILFLLPQTMLVIEKSTATSQEATIVSNNKSLSVSIRAKDFWNTAWVNSITVNMVSGTNVKYNLYSIEKDGNKRIIYTDSFTSTGKTQSEVHLKYSDGYNEYMLVFEKNINDIAIVKYTTQTTVSEIYTLYAPLLALVFVCVSAPLMALVQIKKRKYFQDSIYESV